MVLTVDSITADFPSHWRSRLLNKPLQADVLRRQVEEALRALPCDTVPPKVHASSVGE